MPLRRISLWGYLPLILGSVESKVRIIMIICCCRKYATKGEDVISSNSVQRYEEFLNYANF